jgi:prevent-host-death family protein
MKSVNITELKNRLKVYLNDVKAGEEILVRDRNQPVARIVPLVRSRDEDEELLALASQGKLRLGQRLLEESLWEMPAPMEISRRLPAPKDSPSFGCCNDGSYSSAPSSGWCDSSAIDSQSAAERGGQCFVIDSVVASPI